MLTKYYSLLGRSLQIEDQFVLEAWELEQNVGI